MSLSTCGAMTGFTFAHGTVADLTSPASMPAHLTALGTPATPASSNDSALRSAIVSVAKYYLQMAQSKTPAEMEALIWLADSTDGADHGQSCAAFASLTLALGAQAVAQQSWATGGASYPWPLHRWADVRVQPNPDSPDVVSMLQDAQAHHRWHPLGDGYQPRPATGCCFDVKRSSRIAAVYVAAARRAAVLLANARSHSSGSPALRNPSAKAGGTKDRSNSIFTVSLGLAPSASATTDFASSILPCSA